MTPPRCVTDPEVGKRHEPAEREVADHRTQLGVAEDSALTALLIGGHRHAAADAPRCDPRRVRNDVITNRADVVGVIRCTASVAQKIGVQQVGHPLLVVFDGPVQLNREYVVEVGARQRAIPLSGFGVGQPGGEVAVEEARIRSFDWSVSPRAVAARGRQRTPPCRPRLG